VLMSPCEPLSRRFAGHIVSEAASVFAFDLAAADSPAHAVAAQTVTAAREAEVTGVVQWMELQLAPDIVLSSGPDSASTSWPMQCFWLARPWSVNAGERIDIHGEHWRTALILWAQRAAR